MSRTQDWSSGGHRYSWTVTKGDAGHSGETQAQYDARCLSEWAEQLALHPQD